MYNKMLQQIPASQFVLYDQELNQFWETYRTAQVEDILPTYARSRGFGKKHHPHYTEFNSILKDVGDLVTTLLAQPLPVVGRCHDHLIALNQLQTRFHTISGTKFGHIPDIFITTTHTMQSVYDLYIESLRISWLLPYCNGRADHLFDPMLSLLSLYSRWRLLEEALRPCLHAIAEDDKKHLSTMQFRYCKEQAS